MVCVIANLFFRLTENVVIVHYNNKFPNSGVYHVNFPNLKGPRAHSQNCKKNPFINAKNPLNAHPYRATSLSFGLILPLLPYFVYDRSNRSGKNACMPWLV